MKKLLSLLVILALLLTVIPPTTAQAAVKLNKTSITLNQGDSFKLTLSGTSKTIKWSSSNKKVATVSSRGTVKAIKEGSATITATVSKKAYKCKVKVKDVLTNEEAAEKITYEAYELKDLILVLENKNKVNVQVKVEVTFYDSNQAVLSTETDYIWSLEAGKRAVAEIYYPHDDNYNDVAYDNYKVRITADLRMASTDKVVDELSVESNKGASGIIVTVTNNSDDDISSAKLCMLFYKNDEVVGYNFGYYTDIAAGKDISKEFYKPYDKDYKDVEYDDYEIIINEASFQ